METKAQLIKQATKCAEDNFDKQMLDHLEVIKGTKNFHSTHKFMLLDYVYCCKRMSKETK